MTKHLLKLLPAFLLALLLPSSVAAQSHLPQAGKCYIAAQTYPNGGGERVPLYLMDNGALATTATPNKACEWICTISDGKYNFRNVQTGNFLAHKKVQGSAYNFTLADVTTEGYTDYVSIWSDNDQRFLVTNRDGVRFDQVTTYASFLQSEWTAFYTFTAVPNIDESLFSTTYGEKWVRIQNNNYREYYLGLSADQTALQPYVLDFADRNQLWCLVGNASSFKMYNYSLGGGRLVRADGTGSGNTISFTTDATDDRTNWTITDNGDCSLAISPVGHTEVSMNPYAGKANIIKFYGSADAASKWQLEATGAQEVNVTVTLNREGVNPMNYRLGSLKVDDGVRVSTTPVTLSMFDGGATITRSFLADKCTVTYEPTYEGYTATQTGNDITLRPDNANKMTYLFYNDDNTFNKPFRIPAIATLADGTLLAVSDLRPCGGDIGFGRVDFVCRTSTDNGATWSEMQTIVAGTGVTSGDDDWKCGFGDAALCVDSETGEIVIMCVCGHSVYGSATVNNRPPLARIRGTYRNGTIQWGEPECVDLYALFDTELNTADNQIKAMFIGSGRLFQSRVTKVGSHYRIYAAVCARPGGNRVVYSDDLGQTWHVLGGATAQPAVNGDEPKCEELPDGSVILSSRKYYGRYFNIFTFADGSKTEGTWGTVADSNVSGGLQVGSNSTNGDIYYLPITRDGVTRHFYLQSIPAGNGRKDVSIYRREIDPAVHYTPAEFALGWTLAKQVSTRGSGYSAMTVQADGTLGIFYEEEPGGYCMVYKNYTMDELTTDIAEWGTVNAIDAVRALTDRVCGSGASAHFGFTLNPTFNAGQEAFQLGYADGKVIITANTVSALTTGLNWYLNHEAHVNISWNNLQQTLTSYPEPQDKTVHAAQGRWRYYLNYCTFSYSMSFWDEERWMQEIDWMALHGVNLPLQIVGMDAVWYRMLKEQFGFSHDEASAFIAGPAFQGWWLMNNLTGHGGKNPEWWYERQAALGRKITDRMRELGMTPCLPGYVGMAPQKYVDATGVTAYNGSWCGFTSPLLIAPGEAYSRMAAQYYAYIEKVFGFMPTSFSIDPAHERSIPSGMDYAAACTAARNAMNAASPGALWVAQEWQVNADQTRIDALPDANTLLLDLSSERLTYKGRYGSKQYLFCMLHNYGGNVGMYGCMMQMLANYATHKSTGLANGSNGTLVGVGATPEGIETNPVLYDLLFELPWLSSVPSAEQWLADYTVSRYGTDDANAKAAWENLRTTVYANTNSSQQGCREPVFCARPNLTGNGASSWAGASYDWNKQKVIDAAASLLAMDGSGTNYEYDVVDFVRQALTDHAHTLQMELAGMEPTSARFAAKSADFLTLMDDIDELLGTVKDFRMGKWAAAARKVATDAGHPEDANWMELNARMIVTTWGNNNAATNNGGLRDYGNREWQGLIKDYYRPRWEHYFQEMRTTGRTNTNWFLNYELPYVYGATQGTAMTIPTNDLYTDARGITYQQSYSATPVGDPKTVAAAKFAKYFGTEQSRTVSARSNNATLGTVTVGDGGTTSVCSGGRVTCTAISADNADFVAWYNSADASCVSCDNPFFYTAPEDICLTAVFAPKTKWQEVKETDRGMDETVANNAYLSALSCTINGENTTLHTAASVPASLFCKTDGAITTKAGDEVTINWNGASEGMTYCYLSAYLDSNGDGTFDRLVAVSGTHNKRALAQNGSISFVMPAGFVGVTRLRLRFDGAWNTGWSDNMQLMSRASTGAFPPENPTNRMVYDVYVAVSAEGVAHPTSISYGGWTFPCTLAGGGIDDDFELTLTDATDGAGVCTVPASHDDVNGYTYTVTALDPDFLKGNSTATALVIPATVTSMGETQRAYTPQITSTERVEPGDVHGTDGNRFVWTCTPQLSGDSWNLSATIQVGNKHYNKWGTPLLATKTNPVASDFTGGFQIYQASAMNGGQMKVVVSNNTNMQFPIPGIDILNHTLTIVLHYRDGHLHLKAYTEDGQFTEKDMDITVVAQSNLCAAMGEGTEVKSIYYNYVPDTDEEVGSASGTVLFDGASKLAEVTVAEDNPCYSSTDGLLYSKLGTLLLRAPQAATGTKSIPVTLTSVAPQAFSGNSGALLSLTLSQYASIVGHTASHTSLALSQNSPANVTAYMATVEEVFPEVTIADRLLKADNWNTVVLPFALTADEQEDIVAEAYTLGGIAASANGVTLNFTPVDGTMLAGVPYLVKGKAGASLTFADKTVGAPLVPVTVSAAGYTATMQPNYDWRVLQAGEFFISNNMFYLADQPVNQRGYRAYVTISEGNENNAVRSMLIGLDDMVDGIQTVVNTTGTVDVYDMTGQRLRNAVPVATATAGLGAGLYIVGNQKVMVK